METGDNPITVPGTSNKRRLRFDQFTLKSLLLLMALVGAYFGGRVSMLPQLEAERAKAREAELAKANEPKWLDDLRQAVARANPSQPVVRFRVSPSQKPVGYPMDLDDGTYRAERANMLEQERRTLRLVLPPEELPMGGQSRPRLPR